MKAEYLKQVQLLLDVIPEVAKEECFSLHGGTAINLFVLNMPRLSVDIDLTYNLIQELNESIEGINNALRCCVERILALRQSIRIEHKSDTCKLLIEEQGIQSKVEVNIVNRGVLENVSANTPLCDKAQEMFNAFCSIRIVPLAQLYGGKICAALDRQHPRDLFDVSLLLEANDYDEDIKKCVIYSLVCSNRPTHEMLAPNLINQKAVYENQFRGMTDHQFTYEHFERARSNLIQTIVTSLTNRNKHFLLSINKLTPDWSDYDFAHYPSVKWKLLNLKKFKEQRPTDYFNHLNLLEDILAGN